MKNDTQTDVAAAMNALVQGYREEVRLYMHVRRLTWKQHHTLREGWDLDEFHGLRDEKEATPRPGRTGLRRWPKRWAKRCFRGESVLQVC